VANKITLLQGKVLGFFYFVTLKSNNTLTLKVK